MSIIIPREVSLPCLTVPMEGWDILSKKPSVSSTSKSSEIKTVADAEAELGMNVIVWTFTVKSSAEDSEHWFSAGKSNLISLV